MKKVEAIYKKARAKVNLTLNILNKREDNYHNIESVFQKINLYDELYVQKSTEDNIIIESNIKELEKDNIIIKAYELLKKEYKNIGGIKVILKKNIPMEAGFGGGSSDCGAFIECMNELFELNLNLEEKIKIGARLGADVPATFYNKPVIAHGIGEQIEEIKAKPKFYLIIIKPIFSCGTKKMYERIDNDENIIQEYNSEMMKQAIQEYDIKKIAENLYNVFEEVSDEKIEKIKEELMKNGALNTLMSGSGSSVYGIFDHKENAKKAFHNLKKIYKTFFCITV